MNFDFLKSQNGYYDLFADACIEAEKIYATSPAMCAVGCRKALELAVKWVYAADSTIVMPYKDNLSSLLHEYTFKKCVDERVWRPLIGITKLGNLSVHTDKHVSPADALLALKALFNFVDWIDYCYGRDYQVRSFDETKIPAKSVTLTPEDIAKIKAHGALLAKKNADIEALEKKLQAMADELAAARSQNEKSREFNPEEISEFETRKHYIDWDLGLVGWTLGVNAIEEREVQGMPTAQGTKDGKGYIDYLLLGKDGKPLAVLEAKKTSLSAQKGLQQARLYADCLQKEYGYRPLIFLTNGFETFFIDADNAPMRSVSGVSSQDDLQRLMNRRNSTVPTSTISIDTNIAGGGKNRYYQIEAIKHACNNFDEGHRRGLLVMATGTGKTRVSAGLVDVLIRAGKVKNVLFLADRVSLVSQAARGYKEYLPNSSRCDLCKDKDNFNARIVFSTYPTILNAIDTVKNGDGIRMYTPAHFDLIIVDEAHRSIFKKYRAIFDYFDALILGLTATPANEVDRNTYDFFQVERGVPTYVYEYDTATKVDHVLVPYQGIATHTDFIDNGRKYEDLSDEEKQSLEDDFEETGQDTPDFIAPTEVNKWVFNQPTVDNVLETLMEKGIRVHGGQDIGKTVIFAQNQKHARFIVERFGKLYPNYPSDYIKAVLHSDDYAHTIIEEFEFKSLPAITVSVDMMDTGIDVPEIVNLVFFKKVRSKIKFWQMIGRGTRLCEGLNVQDPLNGTSEDKQRFFIFDWCRNFEFFKSKVKEAEGKVGTSLSELIFSRQVALIKFLQESAFADEDHQSLRAELVDTVHGQITSLNEELVAVRLQRQAIEKYRQASAFQCLNEGDVAVLTSKVAPLVYNGEKVEAALRFDAFMYGFMCAKCEGAKTARHIGQLISVSTELQKRTTIPQVKEKLPLLKELTDEDLLKDVSLLELEKIRKELRGLIQFIDSDDGRKPVVTHLADPVTEINFIDDLAPQEDFTNYKLKVERYIRDHADSLVIHKLRHNKPLTELEFQELGRLFTQELGNAEDYEDAYGDTGFGLLVRKIAHLDHDAANEAFAEFINARNLTDQQIAFVRRVVDYIVENGYMEAMALTMPPFDRPMSFVKMFDGEQRTKLIEIINRIKTNAEIPAA